MAELYFLIMVLRRILAGILVFFFTAISTAAFLVFGVSNTFLRTSFYQETLKEPGYKFFVESTVLSIEEAKGPISEYFIREELREEVENVFPISLFERTVKEMVQEVETLREDPDQPLTFKLNVYRESLLTLAHNLSFKMFENLPSCTEGELPDQGPDGLSTCVPDGFEYNDISGRLTQEFEENIYAAIPEQGQFDVKSAFGESGFAVLNILVQLDTIKVIFYGILLVLLALIALIIYRPFTALLMTEGLAFLLSGIVGIIVGFALLLMPAAIAAQMESHYLKDPLMDLFGAMVNGFSAEIQKGALVFLATGIILLATRYFLNKK